MMVHKLLARITHLEVPSFILVKATASRRTPHRLKKSPALFDILFIFCYNKNNRIWLSYKLASGWLIWSENYIE